MATDDRDHRVDAALAVLGGRHHEDVAAELDVAPDVVRRWAEIFRDAGSAAVRNAPAGREAWMRDRVLAAISHELRTPLAQVRASLDLLGVDTDEQHAPSYLHDVLLRSFRRLDTLLVRLLETTRASYGRTELVRQRLRLSELFDGTDVTLDEDGVVDVDPDRIHLVVEDMVALAERGPSTTSVRTRAGMHGAWAEIVVERHGAPFDPGRLQAELDPFTPRTDHTDVTFGLHLAMALTVLHGGQLGVRRNDGVDEIWVRIPAHPPHDEAHDGADPALYRQTTDTPASEHDDA